VTQQRSCRIDASTNAKIMADLSEVASREVQEQTMKLYSYMSVNNGKADETNEA